MSFFDEGLVYSIFFCPERNQTSEASHDFAIAPIEMMCDGAYEASG